MFKLFAIAIILSLLYSSLMLSAHPPDSMLLAAGKITEGGIVPHEIEEGPGKIPFPLPGNIVSALLPPGLTLKKVKVCIWSTSTLVQARLTQPRCTGYTKYGTWRTASHDCYF
jgi:hypothetical protein